MTTDEQAPVRCDHRESITLGKYALEATCDVCDAELVWTEKWPAPEETVETTARAKDWMQREFDDARRLNDSLPHWLKPRRAEPPAPGPAGEAEEWGEIDDEPMIPFPPLPDLTKAREEALRRYAIGHDKYWPIRNPAILRAFEDGVEWGAAEARAPLEAQVASDRYTINLMTAEQRQFHSIIARERARADRAERQLEKYQSVIDAARNVAEYGDMDELFNAVRALTPPASTAAEEPTDAI